MSQHQGKHWQHWRRWSVAAAAAAVLAGGMPLAAQAQGATLPQTMQQGDVTYVSGGIDSDSSGAFKREMSHWPLSIEMAAKGDGANEYIADVDIKITSASGNTVLDTRARGPFMLVKLPPGKYTVNATYNGKPMSHSVSVPASGHAGTSFLWPHD